MKYIILSALAAGSLFANNTYILEPVNALILSEVSLTNKEKLESQLQLQETSPGLYNPIINGLQGDKISLTIDGLKFSNAIFRSGPNQYFSWIPQEFVAQTEIMPTSDAIGSTLNTELGISESKAYYQFDQYNTGSTAVVKVNLDKTSIGAKFQKTQAYNDQPHTAYNQTAFYIEQELQANTMKALYSESNDIQRPDQFLRGSPFIWEKQYYLLLKDRLRIDDRSSADLSYQRFYEKINEKSSVYETIDDMYGLKLNRRFLDRLNVFVSDSYEDIKHKGDNYSYNTLTAGLEYSYAFTDEVQLYIRDNISYAHTFWGANTKDFYNNAVSVQLDTYAFYTRYDFGYNFPTLQNLAYAQITEKGIDLPNEELKQENSHTFTLGYKENRGGFDYDISIYYVLLQDLIERQKQNYQIGGEDVYITANVNQGHMYGINSFLSYSDEAFAAILTMNYAYGRTDQDYISKVTPFKLFYKMSYANAYLKWKYAPPSHTLPAQDKADVRIEDSRYNQYNNKGYSTVDLGTKFEIDDNSLISADLNNIFNNNGRVLGSSVDVPQRSISLRYSYLF